MITEPELTIPATMLTVTNRIESGNANTETNAPKD